MLTILACVWLAVHRNIPAPKVRSPERGSFLLRAAHAFWSMILSQREAMLVFLVAFIAPEWILAWAIRQMLRARKLIGELEQASSNAKMLRKKRCSMKSDSKNSSREAVGSAQGHSSSEESAAAHDGSGKTPLVHRSAKSFTAYFKCAKCGEIGSQCDQTILKNRFGMGNEGNYLESSV